MRVNIKKVAAQAEVSTATVSHVINQTRYVSEEVRQRVRQAMRELDYQPNAAARSLRSKRSRTVGLILPLCGADTASMFFMEVAKGVEEGLRQRHYHVLLGNSSENILQEQACIQQFEAMLADGLIMVPAAGSQPEFRRGGFDWPVVYVDRQPLVAEGDCVLVNGQRAVFDAVSVLIGKGHTRIGYISGMAGITTSDDRFSGFCQALTHHGLPLDPTLIRFADTMHTTMKDGERLLYEILGNAPPTALMVASNHMTMGALEGLQKRHIRIPEEMAFVGFDDYEWSRVIRPSLSVIRQPGYDLGLKAAELLAQRLENPGQPYRTLRLPAEFIQRESAGLAAVSDRN